MFTMDQIHRIRELYYTQGNDNLADIARTIGCDPRTVKKYVDQEDFSPPQPKPASNKGVSSLDPFKPLIDKWLSEDLKAPRKQRHTAKRVHRRLQEQTEIPNYKCSYRLTADYVAAKKKELRLNKKEGYLPLEHYAGEAQADFGVADFYENGKLHHEAKYLVLSFPYSNGGYLQLNYGENLECLLEGLQAMFEYINGVPTEIWFDNTRTIVTKILKCGDRQTTERFQRFAEHYRFKPIFMNPESGNEKGNVENKVGYLRRNELVPVPRFLKLTDFNKSLLAACDSDMNREHYDKDKYISELFTEDKSALLPLPAVRFDTALYTSVKTDKYGKFTLDKGKHRYSSSPDHAEQTLQLKITSSTVIVMDSDMHEIIRHSRLYGDEEKESMEWLPYLKYIARKPRSLKNSGIYSMMPEKMQKYMDDCPGPDRGKILKVLSELTERNGFDSAINTVNQAITYSATDPDSLQSLYRRLYSDVPEMPPLDNCASIPKVDMITGQDDLAVWDTALRRGGVAHAS